MKILILSIAINMATASLLFSQKQVEDYPVIGKRCPDIVLENIKFFEKQEFRLEGQRGKWLLLDFWTKGCSACFSSFPKLNELNSTFSGQLQVILIGNNGKRTNKGIEGLFEKFRNKQRLTLPVAYDSTIFERFGIYTVPHVVIVDPEGIVRAVTYGNSLTHDKISRMLKAERVDFQIKRNRFEELKLSTGDVGLDETLQCSEMISGSMITPWDKVNERISIPRATNFSSECFEVKGASLIELYRLAYIGMAAWWNIDSMYSSVSYKPVIEVQNDSALAIDEETGKGRFNYMVKRPPGNLDKGYFQNTLRQDLVRTFAFQASIEDRSIEVWMLRCYQHAKSRLKTKGGESKKSGDISGIELVNLPVSRLIDAIKSRHQNQPPILDKTGIKGNIDIKLDALLTDFNSIREALRRNGLVLEKGHAQMKTLVLRTRSDL
jgi:thiol-disulfide isomerase/thioredoxin